MLPNEIGFAMAERRSLRERRSAAARMLVEQPPGWQLQVTGDFTSAEARRCPCESGVWRGERGTARDSWLRTGDVGGIEGRRS